MKSLPLFFAILLFVCRTMEGRYLLVELNDQNLNDHKQLNETEAYTPYYEDRCAGKIIPGIYKYFYEARYECDKDDNCGCIDVNFHNDLLYRIHATFLIKKYGPGEDYCAWVKP